MARKSKSLKKSMSRRTKVTTKRRGHGSRHQKKIQRGKKTKKTRRTRRLTKRHTRGGSPDAVLAYDPTHSTPTIRNPHIAYTGTGGNPNFAYTGTGGNPNFAYTGKGGGHGNVVNPFVGKPWGAELKDLPGVSGPHSGNHYAANPYSVQPELDVISERNTSVLKGGKRRRRTKKNKMKGGMFQALSQLKHDVVNGIREFQGKTPEPSPLPYKDQIFHGENEEDNLGYLRVKNTYY